MTDIFVQITATPDNNGPPKALVVLVPKKNIELYKSQFDRRTPTDELIARRLAEPLAMNLFTHRASFGRFRLAHSYSTTPPHEIEAKSYEFEHDGIKAWIL